MLAQYLILLLMSNPANYSPYNKTYKFILFQNQAYHQRNKRNMSPVVRTNLRHSLSRNHHPSRNPQNLYNQLTSSKVAESQDCLSQRSSLFQRRQIQKVMLSEPKRVVHKNWSFEKFSQKRIQEQNTEMVSRILSSQCQVIKNDRAEKSFKNHLKYQNIRRRYNQSGQRKDVLPLNQSELLCPTLLQFNASGLANRFVESDMSMSLKPSTSQSHRRGRPLNSPF